LTAQAQSPAIDTRFFARWVRATTVGWSLAGSMVVVNDQFIPRIPGLVGAVLYVAVILLGGILLGAAGGATLQRILMPAATAA
jgi:hypothetical protein